MLAALTLISILALIFGAAAYFGESQQPNQPKLHQRYPIYGRFRRPWPDEPTPRKLSYREKIQQWAKMDRQWQKDDNHHRKIV